MFLGGTTIIKLIYARVLILINVVHFRNFAT